VLVRRALIAVAVLAVLPAWYAVTHAGHGRTRTDLPPAVGAYRYSGEPDRDPELERLLLRLASNDTAGLAGSPIVARRGPWLLAAWDRFAALLARGPALDQSGRDADRELRAAARAVTDQLATLGLGYYIDAAPHGTVLVYRVEQVSFVHVGHERRRILELRRLDRHEGDVHVLGMQSELLGDPVVMLDQIDDFVATHLAPVVAGGRYDLGDDSASMRHLGVAAGAAIRTELAARSETLGELVLACVRRHEARHGMDLERDTPLRMPTALATVLGGHGGGDAFALRARAELAAYTTQIASDPAIPQLALWNLASLALHRDRWGSPESYVAVVVIEGLARHAGGGLRLPSVRGGQLDKRQLAEVALPLASLPDDQLRAAARALWQELYDEPFLLVQ
jgi:hypothetical protein